MFRAQPVASKLCARKWEEDRHRQHVTRLRNPKPSIDNAAPKRFNHLRFNWKKAQQEEERIMDITRKNRILLRKMTDIMQKNQLDNHTSVRAKSLNKDLRKRELMRITQENQAILKRIQKREPVYNHVDWELERRRNEEYCRNICEYPFQLSMMRGSTDPGAMAPHGGAHDGGASSSAAVDALGQDAIAEEARRIRAMIQAGRADAAAVESAAVHPRGDDVGAAADDDDDESDESDGE